MKPVKAIDAAFLHLETPETPMHVGALFVLEPPPRRRGRTFHQAFTDVIRTRLGLSEVFTRKLARVPLDAANPMWVTEGNVDLEHHVRRTVLPKPGSMRDLEECVAELHTPPLDRDRPLWELHVIEGLAGGRAALYVKTHHAGLDGASAQIYLKSFVDLAPNARRERSRAPAGETVHMARVIGAAARHQLDEYRKLPELVARLARAAVDAIATRPGLIAPDASKDRPTPRTPLNVAVSGERSFAGVELGLAEVKAVAAADGATVNDVIMSICSGAVRRWLVARAALPDEPLVAAVPVSMRAPGEVEHSIQVSFMNVNLHTDVADPRARLAAIHESALESKGVASRMKSLMPEDLPSVGLPWLFAGAARALARPALVDRLPVPANVLISNVAGPPVPLYVAGARAITYSPVSIPFHGMALNITVYSYDGKLFFGLTGCRRAVPDIHDIATSISAEFRELERASSRKGSRRRRPRR